MPAFNSQAPSASVTVNLPIPVQPAPKAPPAPAPKPTYQPSTPPPEPQTQRKPTWTVVIPHSGAGLFKAKQMSRGAGVRRYAGEELAPIQQMLVAKGHHPAAVQSLQDMLFSHPNQGIHQPGWWQPWVPFLSRMRDPQGNLITTDARIDRHKKFIDELMKRHDARSVIALKHMIEWQNLMGRSDRNDAVPWKIASMPPKHPGIQSEAGNAVRGLGFPDGTTMNVTHHYVKWDPIPGIHPSRVSEVPMKDDAYRVEWTIGNDPHNLSWQMDQPKQTYSAWLRPEEMRAVVKHLGDPKAKEDIMRLMGNRSTTEPDYGGMIQDIHHEKLKALTPPKPAAPDEGPMWRPQDSELKPHTWDEMTPDEKRDAAPRPKPKPPELGTKERPFSLQRRLAGLVRQYAKKPDPLTDMGSLHEFQSDAPAARSSRAAPLKGFTPIKVRRTKGGQPVENTLHVRSEPGKLSIHDGKRLDEYEADETLGQHGRRITLLSKQEKERAEREGRPPEPYVVTVSPSGKASCTCPGFSGSYNSATAERIHPGYGYCRHADAIAALIGQGIVKQGSLAKPKPQEAKVGKNDLKSGIDPLLQRTRLGYHLLHLKAKYKDDSHLQMLIGKALKGDHAADTNAELEEELRQQGRTPLGNVHAAIGERLAHYGDPLSRAYRWNHMSRGLNLDRFTEDAVKKLVKVREGSKVDDTNFYDNVLRHLLPAHKSEIKDARGRIRQGFIPAHYGDANLIAQAIANANPQQQEFWKRLSSKIRSQMGDVGLRVSDADIIRSLVRHYYREQDREELRTNKKRSESAESPNWKQYFGAEPWRAGDHRRPGNPERFRRRYAADDPAIVYDPGALRRHDRHRGLAYPEGVDRDVAMRHLTYHLLNGSLPPSGFGIRGDAYAKTMSFLNHPDNAAARQALARHPSLDHQLKSDEPHPVVHSGALLDHVMSRQQAFPSVPASSRVKVTGVTTNPSADAKPQLALPAPGGSGTHLDPFKMQRFRRRYSLADDDAAFAAQNQNHPNVKFNDYDRSMRRNLDWLQGLQYPAGASRVGAIGHILESHSLGKQPAPGHSMTPQFMDKLSDRSQRKQHMEDLGHSCASLKPSSGFNPHHYLDKLWAAKQSDRSGFPNNSESNDLQKTESLNSTEGLSEQKPRQSGGSGTHEDPFQLRRHPLRYAREHKDFLGHIAADPKNETSKLAYADWLDEHDFPEIARLLRDEVDGRNHVRIPVSMTPSGRDILMANPGPAVLFAHRFDPPTASYDKSSLPEVGSLLSIEKPYAKTALARHFETDPHRVKRFVREMLRIEPGDASPYGAEYDQEKRDAAAHHVAGLGVDINAPDPEGSESVHRSRRYASDLFADYEPERPLRPRGSNAEDLFASYVVGSQPDLTQLRPKPGQVHAVPPAAPAHVGARPVAAKPGTVPPPPVGRATVVAPASSIKDLIAHLSRHGQGYVDSYEPQGKHIELFNFLKGNPGWYAEHVYDKEGKATRSYFGRSPDQVKAAVARHGMTRLMSRRPRRYALDRGMIEHLIQRIVSGDNSKHHADVLAEHLEEHGLVGTAGIIRKIDDKSAGLAHEFKYGNSRLGDMSIIYKNGDIPALSSDFSHDDLVRLAASGAVRPVDFMGDRRVEFSHREPLTSWDFYDDEGRRFPQDVYLVHGEWSPHGEPIPVHRWESHQGGDGIDLGKWTGSEEKAAADGHEFAEDNQMEPLSRTRFINE